MPIDQQIRIGESWTSSPYRSWHPLNLSWGPLAADDSFEHYTAHRSVSLPSGEPGSDRPNLVLAYFVRLIQGVPSIRTEVQATRPYVDVIGIIPAEDLLEQENACRFMSFPPGEPGNDLSNIMLADSVRSIQGGAGIKTEIRTEEEATRAYVDLVKDIPEVVQVRLADDDEGKLLWTLIRATPFVDEPRDRVYRAQIAVMQRMDKPFLGFRLINVRELPGEFLDDGDVPIGEVVWSKLGIARP